MGDVGDGDDEAEAARVGRILVGCGPDRVVEVARVGTVDGDQGKGAQVLARAQGDRFGAGCLIEGLLGEVDRDGVGVNRDQADGAGRIEGAQALDDGGLGQTKPACAAGLGEHDLAVLGAGGGVARDDEVALGAAVGGVNASAVPGGPENADDTLRTGLDDPHDAGLVTAPGKPRQAGEQTVAGPQRRGVDHPAPAPGRRQDDGRRRALALPVERSGAQLAVDVDLGDFDHGDGGQARGPAAPARRFDGAFVGELAQQLLEPGARGAFEAERAGDLAQARAGLAFGDEAEDRLAVGKGGLGTQGANRRRPGLFARSTITEARLKPRSAARRRERPSWCAWCGSSWRFWSPCARPASCPWCRSGRPPLRE